MNIPVGTLWVVPNGVFTSVYVDLALLYAFPKWLGQYLKAVLSI